ncbi:hypothetical protein KIW84_064996 [Lathyrus oleraceus]|uniref:Uncharacterized protein n=1 Tax=Pisum sativum TaxID=3888 RepID=A0A9D4WD36_PEA|nr:hypothetical protein KIW84_064996 [Pisum sativum]
MIVAYVQNDCAEEGLLLFNRMREGFVDGNVFTVGSLVVACTKLGCLHQGKWVHGYAIKNGIEINSFLATSLLNMYVKCGDIGDARSVFDEFSVSNFSRDDLVFWTAMIVGYTQRGYPQAALELFTDEKWYGILPNSVTLASLLSACGQLENIVLGKLFHVLVVKYGLDDTSVRNALVDMESDGSFQYGYYWREADDLHAATQHFHGLNRLVTAIVGHSKGAGVVLLYASKYNDVKTVVNISGRYDLKAGIEERLGKNYMERIKEDGFIDVKRPGSSDYRVTLESLLDRLDTNMHGACLQIDTECR